MKISILCKSIQKCLLLLTFVCLAFFFKSNPGFAQASKEKSQKPLHVVSDKMTAQEQSSMVEFSGNVKAVLEDATVFADSIKIYFNDDKRKKESADQSSVKEIISTGNVKYISKERKAFADKAVYTTKDEILILTGKSPKLITGSSFVTGTKITLFRKQDKVIVESDGAKRVEALFNPEDNITKDTVPDKQ
ncbi:MAG: LptA/OstA family protein [Thermodesulfobacteriota bacterium]